MAFKQMINRYHLRIVSMCGFRNVRRSCSDCEGSVKGGVELTFWGMGTV